MGWETAPFGRPPPGRASWVARRRMQSKRGFGPLCPIRPLGSTLHTKADKNPVQHRLVFLPQYMCSWPAGLLRHGISWARRDSYCVRSTVPVFGPEFVQTDCVFSVAAVTWVLAAQVCSPASASKHPQSRFGHLITEALCELPEILMIYSEIVRQ